MKTACLMLLAVTGLVPVGCGRLKSSDAGASSSSPRSDSGGIRFTDVTRSLGIQFRRVNGGAGRHFYIETMTGGCAFLDYDCDGWLDLLLLQGVALPGCKETRPLLPALYRNIEGRSFTNVTVGSGLDQEFYGVGVAAGDYDNDGYPDLFITALGGNRLFHNERNGSFRDVTSQAGVSGKDLCTGAAWLDYDLDGRLDLFVCRYMDYSLDSDPVCTDSQKRPAYCGPHIYPPTHCFLYHNEGNGRFSDVTRTSGIGSALGRSFGAASADYDGDGLIDIYVANDLTPNFLFLNNGDGTFREEGGLAGVAYGEGGVPRGGMGVDCGDYDNDGRMDIFVSNFENEPDSLFRNGPRGWFEEQSYVSGISQASFPYVGWGCRFVDLDSDGFQDLFVVNGHVDDHADDGSSTAGYAQPCLVLKNEHNGTFADVTGASGVCCRLVARGAAFGDYDNDGDTDVLVASNNGSPVLLRNDSAPRGHSVQLRLSGRGCNRDALGARIRVTTGSLSQTRYVRSGGSCLADHDRRVVFGLGQARRAAVEVRWPCGAIQRLEVLAGQSIEIQEAKSHNAVQRPVAARRSIQRFHPAVEQ